MLSYIHLKETSVGECSGLKINEERTEAYWLGSSHNSTQELDMEQVTEPLKILHI